MEIDRCRKKIVSTSLFISGPMNRLNRLYEIDPNLEKLFTYPANELAELLNITTGKSNQVKREFTAEFTTTPYENLYERHKHYPNSVH